MIFLWLYLAGFLWFWRYHVGYLLADIVYDNDPDTVEVFMCGLLGVLLTSFWPVTVTARGVYVLWAKYVPNDVGDGVISFFPPPKEIESREEKRERKAREARHALQSSRRSINDKERELGMELTRWND